MDPPPKVAGAVAAFRKHSASAAAGKTFEGQSFAQSSQGNVHVLERVVHVSKARMATFTMTGLSEVAWAYASSRVREASLFQLLGETVCTKRATLTPKSFSKVLWSFATVKVIHAEMFKSIADVTMRLRSDFKQQDVANLAWAFAVLE